MKTPVKYWSDMLDWLHLIHGECHITILQATNELLQALENEEAQNTPWGSTSDAWAARFGL